MIMTRNEMADALRKTYHSRITRKQLKNEVCCPAGVYVHDIWKTTRWVRLCPKNDRGEFMIPAGSIPEGRVSVRREAKAERAPREKKMPKTNRLNTKDWYDVDPATLPNDALDIFDEILARKKVADKWKNARFEKCKLISIGDRGDAGEELVLSYARKVKMFASKDGRLGDADVLAGYSAERSIRIEVKTATEGAMQGSFQFNGIRIDKDYDVLLLVAVFPNQIRIAAWSHADVLDRKAGTLVRMSMNNKTDHKISKSAKVVATWHNISDLKKVLAPFIA